MSKSQSDTLAIKDIYVKADFFGKTALALSLWFGVGLLPRAPGTFGTLAAIPLGILMSFSGGLYSTLFVIIFISTAIWSSGVTEKLMGRDDPSEVVIDEVAGFLITIFSMPLSWPTLFIGFILFRFFDILKPFPIGDLEKKIKGGKGIVLDDLMAGVYANLSLRLIIFILHPW